MVFGFLKRRTDRIPNAVYGHIVEQSRRPDFYLSYGVPDTLDGRFDMITLHAHLVFRRLRKAGDTGRSLSQDVFDYFMRDMDASLREMGVGDTSVPKKMKAMAEVFYGRAKAYDDALDNAPTQLTDVIARNVFADVDDGDAEGLASYVLETEQALAGLSDDGIFSARLHFPDPIGSAGNKAS